MNELIPSLSILVQNFRPCFRKEVYSQFEQMLCGWIVCLGKRTISRVWESTGLSGEQNHASAFRLFSSSSWSWDELGLILAKLIVTHLVPGKSVTIVVDDTLCHKRGAKVSFGGIFLDPVNSSKRRKVFRYANNWVMLGIVVKVPCRSERYFCLPILWRILSKRKEENCGNLPHKTKTILALEMLELAAESLANYKITLVGDSHYISRNILSNLPSNVYVVGPINKRALIRSLPTEDMRSCRKKGSKLPQPGILLEKPEAEFEKIEITLADKKKTLLVKRIDKVLWHRTAKYVVFSIVLIKDPEEHWRDEALLTSDLELSTEKIIETYCKRWSVECLFADAKQQLGFHDSRVWCEKSVQRTAPMAWFTSSIVVLWYSIAGSKLPQALRQRPWYTKKRTPTFSDMLATCRLHHCKQPTTLQSTREPHRNPQMSWMLHYIATATYS